MIKEFDQYTDTEIIEKILNGAHELYEIIIRRYNPFLYKIGRAYFYNHEDTQDLMQETYVSAYFNLHSFEKRATLKTWLTKIMLNHCYHKKQKLSFKNEVAMREQQTERLKPMFQQQSNNEQTLINKELGSILEHALQKIPPDYRVVFALRELNGFSVAETADALGIQESNVKVRLNRAKAMLRSQIESMYAAEDIYEFNLVYCDSIVKRVIAVIANSSPVEIPGQRLFN